MTPLINNLYHLPSEGNGNKEVRLTPEYVLKESNDGLSFFQLILGPLKKQTEESFMNVRNPFYNDKNPGLSVFYDFERKRWKYYDHGATEYCGDAFSFCNKYFNLNVEPNSPQLLEKMMELLKSKKVELSRDYKAPQKKEREERPFTLKERGLNNLTTLEIEFLEQYQINKEDLNITNVRFIDGYSSNIGLPNFKERTKNHDQIMLAIKIDDFAKIYQTNPKGFFYLGNKSTEYVFGMNYFEEYNITNDLVIITGGEKDALVLNGLGYIAISLSSETATSIPERVLSELQFRFQKIAVLYDNDETGIKQSLALAKKYSLYRITLPNELKDKGGKDVADYVKLKLPLEVLHSTIAKSVADNVEEIPLEILPEVVSPEVNLNAISQADENISSPLPNSEEKILSDLEISSSKQSVDNSNLDFNNKNSDENFKMLMKMTKDDLGTYQPTNKVWMENLATRSNSFGMDERYCFMYALKYFKDYPIDLRTCVVIPIRNTYETYKEDFSCWDDGTEGQGQFADLTTISAEVYENLPDILKKSVKLLSTKRERDILLLGCIGVLSGCLSKIWGYYDNSKISSNLFFFISAPAAAGKGALKFARYLGNQIHEAYVNLYKEDTKKYKLALQEYISGKKDSDIEKPIEPIKRRLFLPGNSSAAAIMHAMNANDGRGIIFETEADSLNGALMQDWGNFSDLIRKSFHNEPASLMRKSQEEDIEIISPELAMVLTGTPGQLYKLIPDAENGLFSRICFYNFMPDPAWKDVFVKKEDNYNSHYSTIGLQVKALYDTLMRKEGTVFDLSEEQKKIFNITFEKWQQEFLAQLGLKGVGPIRRLGVIHFKISMILSVLRRFENVQLSDQILCEDIDFNVAMLICETLKEHIKSVFKGLPKSNEVKLGYREIGIGSGISKTEIGRLLKPTR